MPGKKGSNLSTGKAKTRRRVEAQRRKNIAKDVLTGSPNRTGSSGEWPLVYEPMPPGPTRASKLDWLASTVTYYQLAVVADQMTADDSVDHEELSGVIQAYLNKHHQGGSHWTF